MCRKQMMKMTICTENLGCCSESVAMKGYQITFVVDESPLRFSFVFLRTKRGVNGSSTRHRQKFARTVWESTGFWGQERIRYGTMHKLLNFKASWYHFSHPKWFGKSVLLWYHLLYTMLIASLTCIEFSSGDQKRPLPANRRNVIANASDWV